MKKPDTVFIALVGALVFFGLVMLFSASGPYSFQKFNDSFYLLKHQALFGLLPGLFLFWACLKINYRFWKKIAPGFFVLTIVLLFLVFVPGIGASFGRVKSWLVLGGFSLQPSEVAKLSMILFLANWLQSKEKSEIKDWRQGLLPFVLFVGIIAIPIFFQPDMGTMFIVALIGGLLYFAAGAPLHFLGLLGSGALALFIVMIQLAPYRVARFTTFLYPELDPQGIGYHINQALLAIGSGGLFGLGLGHSRQKFQYLPEPTADSIFAIIAEELGLIVSVSLVLIFVFLLIRGLSIAKNAPDAFGYFVALGVSVWIAFQAFVNIGSMVGILPLTGLPLPFISYGGTSLAALLAASGIVANISRKH